MKKTPETNKRPSDDSVTKRGAGRPEYSGKHVTRGGEEYAREEHEPGRVGDDKSDARFVTGIGAKDMDPIDKKSPNLR